MRDNGKRYRIIEARYVLNGQKRKLPYGDGFGVDNLEEFRRKFMRESGCKDLRFSYEEKVI